VPSPVEPLGGEAELLRPDLAALLLPQANEGFFVLSMMIRASEPPMKCRRSIGLPCTLCNIASSFALRTVGQRVAADSPLMIQRDHSLLIQRDQRKSDVVTNEQLRAARALLGLSQTEVALRAGLSVPTIKRLEGGFGPKVSDEARERLQKALEGAGIEFIEENGGGAGVRFRRREKA
jgi:DNA-binding XRE family transcriptional regulator